MNYSINMNGKTYVLPKKTVRVMERLDDALKVDEQSMGIRQKMEKLHGFCKEILGEKEAAEVLGSEDIEEVDTSDLALIVLKIKDAYEKPIADFKTAQMREAMSTIPLEKIASLAKSVNAVSNIQQFTR